MKSKKQGISLIVLVITIVVIIILAAAVILTLSKNNPIDNARIANLAQTKDSIHSAIYSYDGSIEAKTEGYFTKKQIILGTVAADTSATDPIMKNGTVNFSIVTGDEVSATDAVGTTVKVYKINAGSDTAGFKKNVGEDLPTAPVSGSYWAVDEEGEVYLVLPNEASLPTWMGKKDDVKLDATLSKMILFAPAGE